MTAISCPALTVSPSFTSSLLDPSANLRTDDHVVGRDDAGQRELVSGTIEVPVRAAASGEHDEERQ